MLTFANELSKCCFALKYVLTSLQICHYLLLFGYILGSALPETFVIGLKKYKQARSFFFLPYQNENFYRCFTMFVFSIVSSDCQLPNAKSWFEHKGRKLKLRNWYLGGESLLKHLFKMGCLTKAIIACHSFLSQRCYSRWSVIWPLPPVQM